MNKTNAAKSKGERKRVRPMSNPIPAEGEDGLFTESWFPICMSKEMPQGKILGRPFMGGGVVVFCCEDGVARVFSAYCPHVDADLAAGQVVSNRIQ